MDSQPQLPPAPSPIDESPPPEDFELFQDFEYTAWWWSTLQFLSLEARLVVARAALSRCTSEDCRAMFLAIEDDLAALLGPRPILDVFMTHLRPVVRQHPIFTAVVAASLVYILLRAGGGLMELAMRFGAQG
jgi:hypothetical protein